VRIGGTTMPKATATILGDIHDAWRAQDMDWLASYLPNDFSHIINVPAGIGPTAGSCHGKKAVIDRWRAVMTDFEFLTFDTSGLMVERNRAAAEIPFRYRHRASGKLFEMTKGAFGMLEDGWPVRLTEYYDVGYIQSFGAALANHDRP
jgi:ketosteroid isomerase-like protein